MRGIAPTQGRELPHGSQMNGTGVEAHVRRLHSRLYRAAADGAQAKVHHLHKLMVRSGSAQLLASRPVTQDKSGTHTPGVDGVVGDTPQKRMALKTIVQADPMRVQFGGRLTRSAPVAVGEIMHLLQ